MVQCHGCEDATDQRDSTTAVITDHAVGLWGTGLMPKSALEPASEAVYTLLNVTAMTNLATGGVYQDVPQDTAFPYLAFEVRETDTNGTLGQIFYQVGVDVHVWSQYEGNQEADRIVSKAVELMTYQTPSMSNFTAILIVHDGSNAFPDLDINGVATKHLVSEFTMTVSEN